MSDTASAPETSATEPVTADLPTGEAPPTPSPPPQPSSKPKPLPLKTILSSLPSNTDAFLAHLQRCLATPSGIDTVLLFICYTSRLTSVALSTLSQTLLLRRSARDILGLLLGLPPTSPPGASKRPAPSPAAHLAAMLSTRLKNLSGLCSETRTIMRLWGLLGMYFGLKRLALKLFAAPPKPPALGGEKDSAPPPKPRESPLVTALAWTQLVNCVVFQALENGAYLSSRGVLGWAPAQQARAMQLSVRVLALYTGIELGRLGAGLLAKRGQEAKDGGAQDLELAAMKRSMAINMAWAPLTLHWSLEKGLVSEGMIGLLGSVPGVIQISKLWRETAA